MSEEKHLFLKAIKGLATKHIASEQALRALCWWRGGGGGRVWGKEGEIATTSLEFEYLR